MPEGLADRVRARLAELPEGTTAAVYCAPRDGTPWLAIEADRPMPCASAIKAAYLVEWFAAHAAALDATDSVVDAVLRDDAHPAIAHFAPAARERARAALLGVGVRRIAEAMISGRGVDNLTYNVAANLVTAWAGGPDALTAKLHARDPAWRGLVVRRYMLADRNERGDNTATARSLGSVMAMLADEAVPGVGAEVVAAARAELRQERVPDGWSAAYAKFGALDSAPATRVLAGWVERDGQMRVYVVMLARDARGAAVGDDLERAARALETELLRRTDL
jgi:hypothetical protein